MKLLVILLCLLFERFLVHGVSHKRFLWVNAYREKIRAFSQANTWAQHAIVQWGILIVLPVLLIASVFFITDEWIWGVLSFILNVIVFYYCLGPDNAFYPPASDFLKNENNPAYPYFTLVNPQLFTPILVYMILGPVFVFFYRMNSVIAHNDSSLGLAKKISDAIEWIPARVTALCYMLAGHFQNGLCSFRRFAIQGVEGNDILLGNVGTAAIEEVGQPVSLPQAESLVEQALVIYLVGCAIITIALWL